MYTDKSNHTMGTDGHIAVRLPQSKSDQNPVIARVCKT